MGIILRYKNFNCMLEIDNSFKKLCPQKYGCSEGDFWGFGCQKDALLAKDYASGGLSG